MQAQPTKTEQRSLFQTSSQVHLVLRLKWSTPQLSLWSPTHLFQETLKYSEDKKRSFSVLTALCSGVPRMSECTTEIWTSAFIPGSLSVLVTLTKKRDYLFLQAFLTWIYTAPCRNTRWFIFGGLGVCFFFNIPQLTEISVAPLLSVDLHQLYTSWKWCQPKSCLWISLG